MLEWWSTTACHPSPPPHTSLTGLPVSIIISFVLSFFILFFSFAIPWIIYPWAEWSLLFCSTSILSQLPTPGHTQSQIYTHVCVCTHTRTNNLISQNSLSHTPLQTLRSVQGPSSKLNVVHSRPSISNCRLELLSAEFASWNPLYIRGQWTVTSTRCSVPLRTMSLQSGSLWFSEKCLVHNRNSMFAEYIKEINSSWLQDLCRRLW